MKMILYKVINKKSRKEQIFSSEDLQTFFRYRHDTDYLKEGKRLNEWIDYEFEVIDSKEETLLETFAISIIAVCSVIVITKLIMLWI
tara:strand:+ start:268 stop:528 length:261 start_codon:yes stop_codon:yes gene_type:complete